MKLILAGDLHYPEIDETIAGLDEARATFYSVFLERFFEIEADAHISLGDLTNFGAASELKNVYDLIGKSERNFYHVLGNHDLYSQTRQEVLNLTGQARYHAITTDEAVLVFLDTAKEMDFDDWGGWIDEEQLEWFEGIVKDSGTKPLMVFAHHPVYNTTSRSDMDKLSIHPSIDMWKILDQKEGTGVFFNGHNHVDSIVNQKNWTFVQLSACLDQHGFRFVEINDEEINISPIEITDKEVLENAPVIYNNIQHFRHNPNGRGEDSDRSCVIPVVRTSSSIL